LLGREPAYIKFRIGDGFVPSVLTLPFDMVITVTDEEAIETTRKLALEEGLLVVHLPGRMYVLLTKLITDEKNCNSVAGPGREIL